MKDEVAERMKKRNAPRRARRRSLRPGRLLLLLLGVALVGMAIESVYLIFYSPKFRLARLEVTGCQTLDPQQVIAQAGVALGKNIFLVRTGQIARRLRQLPAVQRVRLSRRLPDRLVIGIEERRPVAYLGQQQGTAVLFDQQGFAFISAGPLAAPGAAGLARIEGLSFDSSSLGQPSRDPRLLGLMAAWRAFSNARLPVSRLVVEEGDHLTVALEDGTLIKLGAAAALTEKARLAKLAMSRIGGRAEYLDLGCPEAPVWKPRKENGKHEHGSERTPPD